MTQRINLTKQAINYVLLGKRMLLGAGIGLTLITIFLLGVNNPNPEWGRLWMVRPLVIVPLADASGAVGYYLVCHLFSQFGWSKILAHVLGCIGFVIALWLGTVLGLDGTLWH